MSRFNGCKYPLIENSANGRCVDVRLLALTQSYSFQIKDDEKERKYFCYLALLELLDVVQYDEKQRKLIYGTQIYFNIVVETLLAEYTTFITSLYEHIYGDKAKQSNTSSFFFGDFYVKHFTLK